MANANAPMFIQTIVNAAVQIDNAAGTDQQTLLTAGANGTKVEAINVSSTDSVAHVLELYLVDPGATAHLLTQIPIPASSGDAATTPPVSLLQSAQLANSLPYDSNGNRYLYVASGYSLTVASTVAVTADDLLDVVATGGNF